MPIKWEKINSHVLKNKTKELQDWLWIANLLEYFTTRYWEVFTKKKHICPSRTSSESTTNTTGAEHNYYNKFAKQPKPKMSNSFELLQGHITEIQTKYDILKICIWY